MNSPFSIAQLQTLPPGKRLAYVNEHEAELSSLRPSDLDRIGTLLAHASDKDQRKDVPIIGDLAISKSAERRAQEIFEENALTVGIYKAREIALGTL